MDLLKTIEQCAITTREKGFDVSQHRTQMLLIASEIVEALEHIDGASDVTVELAAGLVGDIIEALEAHRAIAEDFVDASSPDDSDEFIRDWDDDYDVSEFLVSATITARKPEVADE